MRTRFETSVTDEVTNTLAVREKTHGDFRECARVSQEILRVLRSGSRWHDLSDVQVECVQMIAHKLHRIVCGDPNVVDHWHDLACYAAFVVRDIEKTAFAAAASMGGEGTREY